MNRCFHSNTWGISSHRSIGESLWSTGGVRQNWVRTRLLERDSTGWSSVLHGNFSSASAWLYIWVRGTRGVPWPCCLWHLSVNYLHFPKHVDSASWSAELCRPCVSLPSTLALPAVLTALTPYFIDQNSSNGNHMTCTHLGYSRMTPWSDDTLRTKF